MPINEYVSPFENLKIKGSIRMFLAKQPSNYLKQTTVVGLRENWAKRGPVTPQNWLTKEKGEHGWRLKVSNKSERN